MARIFLDTSFLLAFIDKEDSHHKEARDLMKESLKDDLYISDHVFAEAVNTVFSRAGHKRAKNFAEYLIKSEIKLVQMNQSGFEGAYQLFQTEQISFTDTTIKSAMDNLGIQKLATFDTDFKRFENIKTIGLNNE
jgi:predicted nucleic acid-binding protein